MKEQYIQTKIIKHLKKTRNAYVVNGNFTLSGVPDLLACIPLNKQQALKHFETNDTIGVFLGIEVKKPETHSNSTKLQKYNLGQIQSLGGLALVASSTKHIDDYLA